MGFFEIEPRRPLLVPTPRGVRLDGSATKRGPVGPRGPQGVGADGAVQVAMSQQAGTAMRVGVNAGTVGLLVIADSKGAGTGLTDYGDRWQDRLLSLLRARFPITGGDTMRGLVPANMTDPYAAMSGRPTTTGTTYPVDTAGLGYNTLQLELGSTVTFPAATWPAASTLPIGYHTHSGANGTLQVLVDGVVQTEIDCSGVGEGEPVRTSIPISAGTHTVSMRPKAGTAPVRVMYAEQRSASTGWHLYDATRPGLAARHVAAGPPGAAQGDESFAAAVAGLPSVRLAVVALGANDMTISTPAQYGSDLRAVVDMVKAGHPTTGVVVVLPAALTDDSAVVDDVQAYHTAARAALVDVPDLSVLAETQLVDTTGPNAGAWLADSVHPNELGHDLISRALAGSLIGLDGPTDALSMVEAAVAPAVADAQAAADSSAQSAADADAAVTLAQQAQAAALEVPDANTAAMIGNPATDTHAALLAQMPHVDVRAYGVVLDGATDNAAAFQAACDAARNLGKPLLIPAGDLWWTGVVTAYTSIRCEGTLIYDQSAANSLVIGRTLTRVTIPGTSLGGLTKGSTSLTGTGGVRGTIELVSTEELIRRDISGAPTYTKRETSVLSPDGRISPPLYATYSTPASLTAYVYPYEEPITVDGIKCRLRGTSGSFPHDHLVQVKRDNVTLNAPAATNATGLNAISAFRVQSCTGVTINSPRAAGFENATDGYGVAIYQSAVVTINDPVLVQCRHGITGAYNKQINVNRGNSRVIDQHWCDGLTIDGTVINAAPGGAACYYAGANAAVRNATILGGRTIFGVRIDTPECAGSVVIDKVNWTPGAGEATLWAVGYSSTQDSTFNWGRTLESPDSLIVSDVLIDGSKMTGTPTFFLFNSGARTFAKEHWSSVYITRIRRVAVPEMSAITYGLDDTKVLGAAPTFTIQDVDLTSSTSAVYINNVTDTSGAGLRLSVIDCIGTRLQIPEIGLTSVLVRGGTLKQVARSSTSSASSGFTMIDLERVEMTGAAFSSRNKLNLKGTVWSGANTSSVYTMDNRIASVTGGILARLGTTGHPTRADGYKDGVNYL